MNGTMNDWIEHFRVATSGMSVSHVWRGHGSALLVEFGQLAARLRRDGSPGHPRGEIGLMIEWSWRIEDERSIVCGSWSGEELWQPAFDRLVGGKVIGLTTFGRLPEVLFSLSIGLDIASFMTAEGDPAWTLFDWRSPSSIAVACQSGIVQEVDANTSDLIS